MKFVALALVFVIASTGASSAQMAVYDAANYAANSNQAATQAQQLAKQAQGLIYQFEQLKHQVESGTGLTEDTWNQGKALLMQLGVLLQNEHAVAVGQISLTQVFRRLYPQYVAPQNFDQMYRIWDSTTQDAAQQALDAAEKQMESVKSTNDALNQQANNVATAALAHNQVAVLQAGTQIAQMQVQATQNLATIEAIRTQYEVVYYQHQLMSGAISETQNQAIDDWQRRGTGASPSPSPSP